MHRKPTIFFKELYKLGPRGNRHSLKLKEAPEPPNSYGQEGGWKSYLTLIVGHFLWKRTDKSEDRGRSPRTRGGLRAMEFTPREQNFPNQRISRPLESENGNMGSSGFENCYGLWTSRGYLLASFLNWGTYCCYSSLSHHCELGVWTTETSPFSLKVSASQELHPWGPDHTLACFR